MTCEVLETRDDGTLIIFDGFKKRVATKSVCAGCKQEFAHPTRFTRKYCSQKCAAEASQVERIDATCGHCKQVFQRRPSQVATKTGFVFCSAQCKNLAQRFDSESDYSIPHYGAGERAYRARALRHYGAKCDECGYKEYEAMLDVDHQDDNRKNNKIENLRVLCVWCHALKTRKIPKHEIIGS